MWQRRCARRIELKCGREQNSNHCSQTPATRRGEEAITATDVRQSATFRFLDFGRTLSSVMLMMVVALVMTEEEEKMVGVWDPV